jgi:hypothetical protein
MDPYQRLIEGLPERQSPGRSSRATEKAMREAVASLPLANPTQALGEVEQLLDGMLATAWSGGERAAALAHLHAPVASLCHGIATRIGAESHPLTPAGAAQAAAAQRLELKLASACAIGLHELCAPAGKPPRFKGKLVTTTLVAGLAHAMRALQWACRQYQAPPAGLWLRLHALYAFATAIGVAEQAVDSPLPDDGPRTAHATYAEALLLALSDPHRFSAQELQHACAVIRCVAGQCDLRPALAPGLAVDTLADSGPGFVDAPRLATSPGMLAVNVEPVVRVFDERIALLPAGSDAVRLPCPGGRALDVSARFLRHLQAGWETAARGHGRLLASHALDVVVGMHALHYVLAGEVDFATFVRRVNSEAVAAGQRGLVKAWPTNSDGAQPACLRGEVLDQSAGGYRLRLHPGDCDGTRLRIGEVIGLAATVEAAEEREWMVGVVRWLTHTEDGESVGVELLHRSARAAGLRPVTREGEALVPQRAVELPGADGQAGLSLLVTSLFAGDVAKVEVILPALPSDWQGAATVGTWRYGGAEPLGAACIRVALAADSDAAGTVA